MFAGEADNANAPPPYLEAFTKLEEYKTLSGKIGKVPILANMTEFGKTPLYTTKQLGANGVSMVLAGVFGII